MLRMTFDLNATRSKVHFKLEAWSIAIHNTTQSTILMVPTKLDLSVIS